MTGKIETAALLRRGMWLEYVTLAWNVVGTLIVIAAAIIAHSIALAGFGLDSLIEIGASTVVIWHLRDIHDGRELLALRLISIAFFALGLYILGQTAYAFAVGVHPNASLRGIAWLVLTVAAMLVLAWAKHATGVALDNTVLKTEARVTLVDGALAGAVLLGLVLNALFHWWWADPLAGLVICFYALSEGTTAWAEARTV